MPSLTCVWFPRQISTVKEAFIDISLPIIEERVSCFCRTMFQQNEMLRLHVAHTEIFPSFFFSITIFSCVLSCDVEDIETIQPREAGKRLAGAGNLRNSRRCFLRSSLSRQQKHQEAERTGACLCVCEWEVIKCPQRGRMRWCPVCHLLQYFTAMY